MTGEHVRIENEVVVEGEVRIVQNPSLPAEIDLLRNVTKRNGNNDGKKLGNGVGNVTVGHEGSVSLGLNARSRHTFGSLSKMEMRLVRN